MNRLNHFMNTSLRRKLVSVTLFSCIACLLLSLFAMLMSSAAIRYRETLNELITTGNVIAENAQAAMAFSDQAEAQRLLDAFHDHPLLDSACMIALNDKVLAHWQKPGIEMALPDIYPTNTQILPAGFWDRRAQLIVPISKKGQRLGYLVLQANFDKQWIDLLNESGKGVGSALLALFVIYWFVIRIHASISKPIETLSIVARNIARERNYAIRVEKNTDDEIGDLILAFNLMLDEIEKRDAILMLQRDHLEQQVKIRTEELTQAKLAAEAATEAKGLFLANMSHEIRTPMNGIIGLANLVLSGTLSDQQRQYMEKLNFSALALLNITNAVLDYSKFDAGRISLVNQPFNLRELLNTSIQLFAVSAEEKGLEIQLHLSDSVPSLLIGDPLRLGQVLNNLIGNAVKFTHDGFVRIDVTKTPAATHTLSLAFAIQDSGIGIGSEQISHLFQSFSQADSSINRRFGGTGLGLAISQEIVKLMGGVITLQSAPDQGSVFSFTVCFPCQNQIEPPELPISNAADVPPVDLQPLGLLQNQRVLLVEDDPINQLVMQRYLETAEIDVTMTSNGLEALDQLLNLGIDFEVILLDMQVPKFSGLDILRILRAFPKFSGTPIILVTATTQQRVIDQCFASGINDCLYKPLLPDDVLNSLLKWMPTRSEAYHQKVNTAGLQNCFDLEKVSEVIASIGSQYMDLLRLFLEKYQHEQAVVLEYLQNKNYDAAIETLHKLAGAAGMLALKALREAALNLENSITIKANSDAESQGYQATHIATMKTLQHLLCIDYSLGSVEIQ